MLDVDDKLLQEMTRRIVDTVHPQKVILFGSRARGDARSNSDIDVLVVTDSTEPRYKRAIPLYRALRGVPVPVDTEILVYTPDEVEEWRNVRQAFVTTVVREGRVLYEE